MQESSGNTTKSIGKKRNKWVIACLCLLVVAGCAVGGYFLFGKDAIVEHAKIAWNGSSGAVYNFKKISDKDEVYVESGDSTYRYIMGGIGSPSNYTVYHYSYDDLDTLLEKAFIDKTCAKRLVSQEYYSKYKWDGFPDKGDIYIFVNNSVHIFAVVGYGTDRYGSYQSEYYKGGATIQECIMDWLRRLDRGGSRDIDTLTAKADLAAINMSLTELWMSAQFADVSSSAPSYTWHILTDQQVQKIQSK